jgi:hypothetical protein
VLSGQRHLQVLTAAPRHHSRTATGTGRRDVKSSPLDEFKGRSRVPHFYSRALQSSCHALRQQLVVDAERAIRRLGPSVARDEQEFVLAGCGADKTVIERGAGQARFG